MTATTIRQGARVAVLIVVLVLAAVLGLIVGNALQGRSSAGVGAPAPGAALERAGQRHAAPSVEDTSAPAYADPYLTFIRQAARTGADDQNASLTRPAPR